MTVLELKNLKETILLNNIQNPDLNISEFYSCDLLSFAMGHANKERTCLITVIANMNVIAIASLLDYSAVIFSEGVKPSIEVIKKAEEENIPLFTTKLSSLKIYKEILDYESKI